MDYDFEKEIGPRGYIHVYEQYIQTFIGRYLRSQVSVYRTIGPLVIFDTETVISLIIAISLIMSIYLYTEQVREKSILGSFIPIGHI